MLKPQYTLEIAFLLIVISLSLLAFSSLALGEQAEFTAYHVLHFFTILGWLLLLLRQLFFIRQRRFDRHRAIGMSIFFAGPVLVAALTLLTVHSAAKEAVAGQVDDLVVQNVMFALEAALLIFLAFILRHNRKVHGSLLLSTALLFLVIGMFFTLIAYVPGYRSEGPELLPRFAEAGQMSALIGSVIGLLFFLKSWRTGWPWILTSGLILLDGYLQMIVDQANRTKSLTMLVASIGEAPAFGLSLLLFAVLLWVAWKVKPARGVKRRLIAEPIGP